MLHLGADVAQSSADEQLVGPADAIGDDRGAIGTIERGECADDAREINVELPRPRDQIETRSTGPRKEYRLKPAQPPRAAQKQ